MRNMARRIDQIERRLEPEKGEWLKWPCPDGSFIEVPGCRTLVDVYAKCSAMGRRPGGQLLEKATKSDKILRNRGAR